MNKVYIITYNTDLYFNPTAFHGYINYLYQNHYIIDWWHYTTNAYMVVTSLDVNSLYNAVFPGIPRRYLLIIVVDPNNAQGWLPKDAWTWLQKYQSR